MKPSLTLDFLQRRKTAIIADMKFKMDAEDWHGVADAGMDLREVEAQMEVLKAISIEAEQLKALMAEQAKTMRIQELHDGGIEGVSEIETRTWSKS